MDELDDYILELAAVYMVNISKNDGNTVVLTIEPPTHDYEPNYADELIYHMISDVVMKLPENYQINEIDLYWKRESNKKPRLHIRVSSRETQ